LRYSFECTLHEFHRPAKLDAPPRAHARAHHSDCPTLNITASFGVTMAEQSEVDTETFVGPADGALYRAKEQGRNCVSLSVEAAVA
jgi:GGDEF domain-containing protein